jgi:quinohemoprotein amine dehydrogenase
LYGANLPAALKPADLDFGTGTTVKRIVKTSPALVTVEVEVAANAAPGIHDVALAHSVAERAIAIYDKVAYIKVMPDASMARLGGAVSAKQFAQFEAIAYAAGADGKTQTVDDIPLGPVKASWGMEEFTSTPDDDDLKFVGNISESGMFTPSLEGPNPERKKQTNNYATNNWGDVWIAATYESGGKPLKARSYLVVTIPTYVRWDQPEVGQ